MVKVGRLDGDVVEIIEGLEEGERIVTSAQFLLDSESSKTSDFRRLHHADQQANSVWVLAEILTLTPEDRSVTLWHDAIQEWGRPAMIMEFLVSNNVDFKTLNVGNKLHVEIHKVNDHHEIFNIKHNAAQSE
jgi:Cu(I)/Ag(I) efflux system membrane fusion protein